MNNASFGKAIQNVRKHGDNKLVISERRRNYSVSEPNLNTTKFYRKFISNKNEKKWNTYEEV